MISGQYVMDALKCWFSANFMKMETIKKKANGEHHIIVDTSLKSKSDI